jgi:hypothetical protein
VKPCGSDLIDITGAATLQGCNVLAQLRAAPFRPSDTYPILTAAPGVSGAFAGVSTLNPFVSASLACDANNVWLAVQRGFQNAGGPPIRSRWKRRCITASRGWRPTRRQATTS